MPTNSKKITVIGCGVIGLSSGIKLLEAGFDVEIIARELPPATTSDVAAAIWYPYRCYPEEKALHWGKQTLETCYKLSEVNHSGVSIVEFTEYLPEPAPDPWWKNAVKQFCRLSQVSLPGLYRDGFLFEVPFIDSSLHMPWLVERFKKFGGKIRKAAVQDFEEIDSEVGVIVNCAGIGAGKLANDKSLYPVKGQSVRIKGTSDGGYYLDQHGSLALSYVLPRSDDIVLGGTAVEHDTTTEPEEEITEQIIRKARQLDPSLQIDEIKHVAAGLRPARSEVRLESEQKNGRHIIHNYGHGGAGYTLSWGCAEEVVELVKKALIVKWVSSSKY
jgi:D-amino-acid oxidase